MRARRQAVGASARSAHSAAILSARWCGPPTASRGACDRWIPSKGCVLSESVNDLNFIRECLRLAADFTQLARDAVDPDVQAHCQRMAAFWTDRAAGNPNAETDDLS